MGIHDCLAGFYRSADVRERIAEYCGARGEQGVTTTLGLAGYGGRARLVRPEGAPCAVPLRALDQLYADGADVCRSLADDQGALVLLDVDYVDPRNPADPYLRPEPCFERLEPVYAEVLAAFAEHDLSPLVLLTGRGYHFVLRFTAASGLQSALASIGREADWPACRACSAGAVPATDGRSSASALAAAHEGAGRLLEHLAHRVLRGLRGTRGLPVSVIDIPPADGAPYVCLDLSAHGDPLFTRHVRCAFSSNQKASVRGLAPERPFVISLPRDDLPLRTLLDVRADAEAAAALASRVEATIPDAGPGAFEWIEAYRRSPLHAFHQDFDRGPWTPRDLWPFTYDALDLAQFPPCAVLPLAWPNPMLLDPTWIRTVTLPLLTLGWHPRSVASLVRSKYEWDHAWGDLWSRYDPWMRASYYVRLVCALMVFGLEDPASVGCEAQRLRGVCPGRCSHPARLLVPALAEKTEVGS